jgi:hypothetical protein
VVQFLSKEKPVTKQHTMAADEVDEVERLKAENVKLREAAATFKIQLDAAAACAACLRAAAVGSGKIDKTVASAYVNAWERTKERTAAMR